MGGTLLADAWFGWSSWDAGGRGTLRLLAHHHRAGRHQRLDTFLYPWQKASGLNARVTEAHYPTAEQKSNCCKTQAELHMLLAITLANLRALIGADSSARAKLASTA